MMTNSEKWLFFRQVQVTQRAAASFYSVNVSTDVENVTVRMRLKRGCCWHQITVVFIKNLSWQMTRSISNKKVNRSGFFCPTSGSWSGRPNSSFRAQGFSDLARRWISRSCSTSRLRIGRNSFGPVPKVSTWNKYQLMIKKIRLESERIDFDWVWKISRYRIFFQGISCCIDIYLNSGQTLKKAKLPIKGFFSSLLN